MRKKTLIVTRHSGAVRWLNSKGINGINVYNLKEEDVEKDDVIYGVLPLQLVAIAVNKGAEVNLLTLPNIAYEDRGRELSPEEMDKAGVSILRVSNISLEEIIL